MGELGPASTDPQLDTNDTHIKNTPSVLNMQQDGSNRHDIVPSKVQPDTVDDVLKWVTDNPVDVISSGWIDKVKQLDDIGRSVIKRAVKAKTGESLTILNQQLSDVIKVWGKEQAKALNLKISAARKNKGIVEIEYAPAATRSVTLEAAMAIVNDTTPGRAKVFRYGDRLVRVLVEHPTTVRALSQLSNTSINYPKIPVVRAYDRITLKHRLELCAEYVVKDDDNGNTPKPFPNDIIDGISSQTEVEFPILTGIIRHPFVGSDGDLVTRQGYDPSTGLYAQYAHELSDGLIKAPIKKDVEKALEFLCDRVFEGFPFVNKIDKIAAVAAMLTAIQRKMIADDSGCPGFLIDAPTQGTGKTTVVQIVSYSIFGRSVAASSLCDQDTEIGRAHV